MSLLASMERWKWKFLRLKYRVLTFRDHGARLNRSVEVEQALYDCAKGRREALTRDECALLAAKLGVPDEFRTKQQNNQPKGSHETEQ